MKKTSLYLPPELDAALAHRAAGEGLTKAEFIRRALQSLVEPSRRPRLSTAVFRSTDGGVATDVDPALRDTAFGVWR